MADQLGPQGQADPLDGPMLDGLECSIEDPTGFQDPLIEQPESQVDELGRMLDGLEADIEASSPAQAPPETEELDEPVVTLNVISDLPSDQTSEESEPPVVESDPRGSFETPPPPIPHDSSAATGRSEPPRAPVPRRGGGSACGRRGRCPLAGAAPAWPRRGSHPRLADLPTDQGRHR